jgi:hypothetical protein
MVNITKGLNFFALFLLFLTGAMNLGVYVQTKDELGDKLESMRNGGASAVGLTSVFFILFGGYKYFTRGKSPKNNPLFQDDAQEPDSVSRESASTPPIRKPPVPNYKLPPDPPSNKRSEGSEIRDNRKFRAEERQLEESHERLESQKASHSAFYNVGLDKDQATILQKLSGLLLGICLSTFGAFTINASIKLGNYNKDAEKKYENQRKILIGTGVTNLLFGFILIAYNFYKMVKK